jgi:DNA uptake protein ComE-like DNA-binding protein
VASREREGCRQYLVERHATSEAPDSASAGARKKQRCGTQSTCTRSWYGLRRFEESSVGRGMVEEYEASVRPPATACACTCAVTCTCEFVPERQIKEKQPGVGARRGAAKRPSSAQEWDLCGTCNPRSKRVAAPKTEAQRGKERRDRKIAWVAESMEEAKGLWDAGKSEEAGLLYSRCAAICRAVKGELQEVEGSSAAMQGVQEVLERVERAKEDATRAGTAFSFNINTVEWGTVQKLITVPMAARLEAARKGGPFKDVADLMRVPGMGMGKIKMLLAAGMVYAGKGSGGTAPQRSDDGGEKRKAASAWARGYTRGLEAKRVGLVGMDANTMKWDARLSGYISLKLFTSIDKARGSEEGAFRDMQDLRKRVKGLGVKKVKELVKAGLVARGARETPTALKAVQHEKLVLDDSHEGLEAYAVWLRERIAEAEEELVQGIEEQSVRDSHRVRMAGDFCAAAGVDVEHAACATCGVADPDEAYDWIELVDFPGWAFFDDASARAVNVHRWDEELQLVDEDFRPAKKLRMRDTHNWVQLEDGRRVHAMACLVEDKEGVRGGQLCAKCRG